MFPVPPGPGRRWPCKTQQSDEPGPGGARGDGDKEGRGHTMSPRGCTPNHQVCGQPWTHGLMDSSFGDPTHSTPCIHPLLVGLCQVVGAQGWTCSARNGVDLSPALLTPRSPKRSPPEGCRSRCPLYPGCCFTSLCAPALPPSLFPFVYIIIPQHSTTGLYYVRGK